MKVLSIAKEDIQRSLAEGLKPVEVEPGFTMGVISYTNPDGRLLWTPCMDGLEDGWDVYDSETGAVQVVVLEGHERHLLKRF